MLNLPVDLSACDHEPIHIIGAIQPIGALIAIDAETAMIGFASANSEAVLARSAASLLGRPLSELLGEEACAALLARDLTPSQPELLRPHRLRFARPDGGPLDLECYPHRHDGRIILEFVAREAMPSGLWDDDLVRQRIISDLIRPETLMDLAKVGADILRQVTGFDRVMIYRFAPDRHGEVIAESTARDDSFLGLHYPASDIPEPARRHFVLNVIRSISDIGAVAVPILTLAGVGILRPLDLTFSKLRAVAPVHVEYLGNMGVAASLSISLISNQALWGLVACHHYEPKQLSFSRMRFCELIGGTISALLQSLENTVQLRHSIRAEKLAFAIERAAGPESALADVVMDHATALMAQCGASGMALRLGASTVAVSHGPLMEPNTQPLIESLAAGLGTRLVDGIATCDHLAALFEGDAAGFGPVAGAAMMALSEDAADWLILFRPEFEETILWAGKPEKLQRLQDDGSIRLSPRGSFALWREERSGRSQPFTPIDDEVLRITRRALFAVNSLDRQRAAIAAKAMAEAEETRLRLVLLDSARDRSLGELASALAHELNQPLSAVTNYVNACRQELKNHGVAIPDTVTRLIQNAVAESSRAADLVRRLRNLFSQGKIALEPFDLHAVIRQGIDLALAASTDRRPEVIYDFQPGLPHIWIDPVQIAQVVLNLVRNSLTAMHGSPQRVLTVATALVEAGVEVAVSDTGVGVPVAIEKTLFEPFHNSTTSGMGIGLSLCRSIVEAHGGQIRIEPVPVGTRVVFTLKETEGHDD